MDRVIARMGAADYARELEEFETAAVSGGSRYYVAANPNSGNTAGDEGYWVFD
jgi:hypothetical protein